MNSGIINFILKLMAKLVKITAEQGAINSLYPMLSPENKETGKYYSDGIKCEPNKIANDQDVANKLWDVSEKILKDHGMI
jgi:hypothetical protein